MPLRDGSRLGPYEVLAPIGAGGMGEVYRARDTRLDRTVAIKVLPDTVAGSPRRRQRLEREARTISQLSHPHICTLYDIGHQEGTDFLVMEYLEGETLADRLERGPLPIGEVLDHAVQISAALDKAHRHGVTHRDLKPGNIMLTKSGAKLLDFGLAKLDTTPAQEGASQLSGLPTVDASLTAEGTILGTFRYMAPEQLEGKEADARSDLWALGLIIYEMATGTSAFESKSQAGLIAAILERDPPPLATLQPKRPPALDRLVQRCLAKDPEERWQSARDLSLELRWIREAGSAADTPEPVIARHGRSRERIAWAALAVALAVALGLVLIYFDRPPSQTRDVRFSLPLPEDASVSSLRVSPDGRYLSFVAGAQLWLRPLDALAAHPLPGTEGARFWFHFWSPDSRFIGFMAEGKLKKIDINGGPSEILAELPGSGPFQLGSWGRDGTILYNVAEAPGHDGLYRVSEAGGDASRVRIVNEAGTEVYVFYPSFLPDGRHFVFFGGLRQEDGGEGPAAIYVASLDTLRATELLDVPSYVLYVPPGYLLYARGGALYAHPFDAAKLRLRGEPFRIVERVEMVGDFGVPSFSASGNGILAYHSGRGRSRLIWKDRKGLEAGQIGEPAEYGSLRLSPDGNRLMVSIGDPKSGTRDLWLFELDRDVATRFTSDAFDVYGPLWSPDGSRVVFSMPVDEPPSLHQKALTGGGVERLLPPTGTMHWANDWSSDGRFLLYSDRDPDTDWDLWILPLTGDRKPISYLRTRFREWDAHFSPDGRLVAFVSDESGDAEIYVQPFEADGEKRRMSIAGGSSPRWRRDGKELFYLSASNQLMAVPVELEEGFEPGTPTALFAIEAGGDSEILYDVSSDGQRFVVNSAMPETEPTPTVVLDWRANLPQRP